MAIFRCKSCGGSINLTFNQTVVTCEYCGSVQTVPSNYEEGKIELFNRANELRRKCFFDKALIAYQMIVSQFPQEAEAYWGLVLCKFGIEYVEDPRDGERIPTIHRSSFESILNDPDYLSALEYADVLAREQYKLEANKLAKIQNRILAISQKEEPFDIFICYKETDENKQRTIDSVIAQDIYDELTDRGYKVFFSRITLEDKLGSEYEPYIFAALNSAKIMLVIGSKAEYYNAVWVRNEWSRYISLLKGSTDHYLIPCYKNIDAYDMPTEFLPFQSQDLNKLGYMQDLVRGIDKIMGKGKSSAKKSAVSNEDSEAIDALKVLSETFLKANDFNRVTQLMESILKIDPKNDYAYFTLFLMDYGVNDVTNLVARPDLRQLDCLSNPKFIKANEYAKGEVKAKLELLNSVLREYLNDQLKGDLRLIADQKGVDEQDKIYQEGLKLESENKIVEAIGTFRKVLDHKDAADHLATCRDQYVQVMAPELSDENYQKVKELISAIEDEEERKIFNESLKKYLNMKRENCKKENRMIDALCYDIGIYKYCDNYNAFAIAYDEDLRSIDEDDLAKDPNATFTSIYKLICEAEELEPSKKLNDKLLIYEVLYDAVVGFLRAHDYVSVFEVYSFSKFGYFQKNPTVFEDFVEVSGDDVGAALAEKSSGLTIKDRLNSIKMYIYREEAVDDILPYFYDSCLRLEASAPHIKELYEEIESLTSSNKKLHEKTFELCDHTIDYCYYNEFCDYLKKEQVTENINYFRDAAAGFKRISFYKDSSELASEAQKIVRHLTFVRNEKVKKDRIKKLIKFGVPALVLLILCIIIISCAV